MKNEKNLDIILEEESRSKVDIDFNIKVKEVDYSMKEFDYLKVYHEFSEIYVGSNQGFYGLEHNSKSDPDYNHLFF